MKGVQKSRSKTMGEFKLSTALSSISRQFSALELKSAASIAESIQSPLTPDNIPMKKKKKRKRQMKKAMEE